MGVLEQGRNRIRKEKLSIAIEGAGRGTPEQFSREGAREFIRRCSDFSLFIFLDNKIRKDEHRSLSSELNLEGCDLFQRQVRLFCSALIGGLVQF